MSKSIPHFLDPHQTELAKLLRANTGRHRLFAVFRDFCELAALSLSNAVDRSHYEQREARYLEIVGGYERQEVARFPLMLTHLVESLQGGLKDSLGQIFMNLELGDDYKGQYFTPYSVAAFMAQVIAGDARATVAREGFITVCEPTVGAGGMLIGFAEALMNQEINYQQAMHATAVDIDSTAVHMAYVQLSLLHVPAIVLHGNSLSLEVWDYWVTPAHVLGLWDHRLRSRDRQPPAAEPAPQAAPPAAVAVEERPEEQTTPVEDIAEARTIVVERRVRECEQLALFA